MDKGSKKSKKVVLWARLAFMEAFYPAPRVSGWEVHIGSLKQLNDPDTEDYLVCPEPLFKKIAGWSPEGEGDLVTITIRIERG